jgi:hypothetical protein
VKTYFGVRNKRTQNTAVFVRDDGQPVLAARHSYVLEHVVVHSSDGFEWSDAGSGPADLALSILADHFGEDPRAIVRQYPAPCQDCGGDGFANFRSVVNDHHVETIEECPSCDGDGVLCAPPSRAADLYTDFKMDVVARLSRSGFVLTTTEIDAWLALQSIGVAR